VGAFTNNISKAIWAIRGGYGAAKLIPFLDELSPPKTNKLLLGFSDITALHLFLENKWHHASLHCAVINQLINNPELLYELKPILFGEEVQIIYDQLIPLNDLAKLNEIINATITGGNLSIVQTSIATSWQINTENKIIFLEDVGEEGYRIDRMLNQLLEK
jgi:muramoyltetrapeptide carboxypeptidase